MTRIVLSVGSTTFGRGAGGEALMARRSGKVWQDYAR
jgi:hypothetical protein